MATDRNGCERDSANARRWTYVLTFFFQYNRGRSFVRFRARLVAHSCIVFFFNFFFSGDIWELSYHISCHTRLTFEGSAHGHQQQEIEEPTRPTASAAASSDPMPRKYKQPARRGSTPPNGEPRKWNQVGEKGDGLFGFISDYMVAGF